MDSEELKLYLGVFLDEANEQLEILEQSILKLEQGCDKELLQVIFRAAHTLKGSSKTMGFNTMGELTHAMEDVFDNLRTDKLAVSPALVDTLFASLDLLKSLVAEVSSSGEGTILTDVVTARLREALGGNATTAPVQKVASPIKRSAPKSQSTTITNGTLVHDALSDAATIAIGEAQGSGLTTYCIDVSVAEDSAMKSVRGLMVLQSLERVGSVIATTPSEEDIENEKFEISFGVVFCSSCTVNEIRQVVQGISEISGVVIYPRASIGTALLPARSPYLTAEGLGISETLRLAVEDALSQGSHVFKVLVSVADDCAMTNVRGMMVLAHMKSEGSLIECNPSEEGIDADNFGHKFEVIYATAATKEEVRKLVYRTSEIGKIDIIEVVGHSVSASVAETPQSKAKVSGNQLTPAANQSVGLAVVTPLQAAETKVPVTQRTAPNPTQSQTVRVDVTRLDNLLNLVGELVIDQTRIAQLTVQVEQKLPSSPMIDQLKEASAHFARITSEMQEEVMKARMLPIDSVFNRFPRMMRDLGQKLGKELDFILVGRETELDRSVIEVIGDPLIHLLRNSVDHGLETPDKRKAAGKSKKGSVWLRARHEESFIVIEIEDDGGGLPTDRLRAKAVEIGIHTADSAARLTEKEAMNLIFASGFTTAEVTTEVSGRGVGMDIVRSNLNRFGAIIDISSTLGQGTKFTIKLPLTLAIIRGLLVNVCNGVFVVPLASVMETLRVPTSGVHCVNHREVIVERGVTIPLLRLSDLFFDDHELQLPGAVDRRSELISIYVVVVKMGDKLVGLVVDSLLGEQEIVIKSLGKFVGDVRGIDGATILGDGRIALIVDINGLMSVAAQERVLVYAT